MTKTEHYQLPQWEAHDPLRREDFNASMERIDAAVAEETAARAAADAGLNAALGTKAEQTALEELEASLNSTDSGFSTGLAQARQELSAQIEAARAAAQTAQQTADAAWSPDNPPFVLGSYRGSGNNTVTTRKIAVGFPPSMILVTNEQTSHLLVSGQEYLASTPLTWDGDGITLTSDDPVSRLDSSRYEYFYCAFR